MTYKAFTEQDAIDRVRTLGLIGDGAVEAEEIGDGNLNLVFRIREGEHRLILKQALPYAKIVGESWPLSLERAWIEQSALREFARHAVPFVPRVFHASHEEAYTVMEDLSHLTIVRSGLLAGEQYPLLAEHIGSYLARTLFHTSDFALGPVEKKRVARTYYNPDLCDITEKLIFTDPFHDAETNEIEAGLEEEVARLWADDELKREVAKLEALFITKGDALLHGDLHTGSIFASATETKVIDPEFAFYGPFGFDVGQFIAHLFFAAYPDYPTRRDARIKDIDTFWLTFASTFRALWEREAVEPFQASGLVDDVLSTILQDALGFAGCELIRRTIGLAPVADLESIDSTTERLERKRHALRLGAALIKRRTECRTFDDLRNFDVTEELSR
ncbi:S-methyl-5-thioribose kinase [Exiguobacterium sp. LL15]|uniref:S-methyl-5-thioribose kinase n=1 Tax=Exiguobacterium sp. LL15 TaxID=2950547 RepID=UPI00210C1C39|nr:S-methyl-5-thioribose kinase [Exiguobacterium sp. LL15]MCQ4091522.1 S-methyl-5-thioribose kinase [Exiguobacterium sp. LL15]